MSHKKFILLLLPLVIAVSGCVNKHVYTPFDTSTATRTTYQLKTDNPYRYQRQPIAVKNHTLHNREDEYYRVRHIRLPSFGENGQKNNLVSSLYYQSKGKGKKKLVIVLPIWGSYTYPSRKITNGILARSRGDTNVLYVFGKDYLFDWEGMGKAKTKLDFQHKLKRMADRFRTHIIDVRRLIDWAIQDGGVKKESIGVIGFSMSALEVTGVLVSDDRIAAGVLVMGGTHPHEIFTTCDGLPEMVRNRIMARFHWTREQVTAAYKKEFYAFDTTHFSGTVDPRKVIMFDAHNDDCMPRSSRDDLWVDMGKPTRYSFLYKHKKSFYSMTPLGGFFMRYRIYEFLKRRLQ